MEVPRSDFTQTTEQELLLWRTNCLINLFGYSNVNIMTGLYFHFTLFTMAH